LSLNGNNKKIYYFAQFRKILQGIVYIFFLKYIFDFACQNLSEIVLSIYKYAHRLIYVPEISKNTRKEVNFFTGHPVVHAVFINNVMQVLQVMQVM
jgi:ABC-type iron transport system FetAB permease component